tara:strand:+ start:131 stop:355 length:225 start_codon:yes stop_codon:yes gene_type:complete
MITATDFQTIAIPFIVTLFFFYIEALIHYNMGRYGEITCDLPPSHENWKMIGIISGFSLISSIVTYYLKNYYLN